MSSVWLRVDGYAGYAIGAHSAPTWETLALGGCGAASVEFSTSSRVPHHALRKTARFQILYGPQAVYTGTVTEFDRQTGTLHAKGLGLSLYDVLALDSLGAVTRDIGVAVTQAITAGRWLGTNPFAVSGVADGDADSSPISIGALLDQYAEQTGTRWGGDELGRLYLATTPTEPDWIVAPDGAAFGETSDDSPRYLAGRYVDAGAVIQAAFAGEAGVGREDGVDLTERGALTEAEAEGILAGMLTLRGSTSWVNTAELTSDQITTIGGTGAFLPTVRAGHLMRSFGIGYLDHGALTLNTIIGKTVYTAGARTVRVEPVNKAPRTAAEVWAA